MQGLSSLIFLRQPEKKRKRKKKSLENRTERCVWISEDHKAEVNAALLPLALARRRNDLLIRDSSEVQ